MLACEALTFQQPFPAHRPAQRSRDSPPVGSEFAVHPEIAAEALAGLGEPPAATSSAAHPPARTLFSSKDVRLPAGLQHSLAVEAEAQRQAKVRVSQRGAGPPPTEAERADRVPAASSPPHPGAGAPHPMKSLPLKCVHSHMASSVTPSLSHW